MVNTLSPTGYPMRMLRNTPAIGAGIRPNCEAYGYLLDGNGGCAYINAYNAQMEQWRSRSACEFEKRRILGNCQYDAIK